MPSPLVAPITDFVRGIGKPGINRGPSTLLAVALPLLLVMAGSLSPTWPIIAAGPVVPPLGFILLLAWQHLRPGLFPVWAGLPLGLFDDLFSGQPLGSAVLLWSLAMILLDILEARFPWRGVVQNWLVGGAIITGYVLLCAQLAGGIDLPLLLPQIALSILAYPLAARLVGAVDRLRLIPIRKY